MEAAPPSYEKATLVDYWDLIANYIPTSDLCSAVLVNSRWHATFGPHLWGNPASHFGIENDRVYVALTRFKRTLQTARLLVRSLTHTLHLPPAHAELYNGPHADWLRDILERLPNLQSLIVRGLPFFDHSALQALKHRRPSSSNQNSGVPDGVFELPASVGFAFQRPLDFVPSYGLRLLDASRCPNVTASGLAQALSRFESLLYLDLSFTYPAREPIVLKTLRSFTGLQVLKLRGVNLSDQALDVLAPAISRRVRSLDIRDNNITDRSVRKLLDECFTISDQEQRSRGGVLARQRSPALLPYMGSEMLGIYQSEDFEGYLRNMFTRGFVGRLAIEDAPEGGLTHLYVAGNQISVEGVSGLVRSNRLHVLDVESVSSGLVRHLSGHNSELEMPGAEKLTPVMAKHAGEAMTFLRIDHSLVTKDAPNMHAEQIVQGRVELADTMLPSLPLDASELDATAVRPDAIELPVAQTPRYELPGDPMQFVVSPALSHHQEVIEGESPTDAVRRGSAFAPEVADLRRGSATAPEVIDTLSSEIDCASLLSPVSALEESTMMNISFQGATGSSASFAAQSPLETAPGRTVSRPRSYSSVADERRARLNAHTTTSHNLHPAMLPHLTTLVLTGVPPFSSSRDLSDRIVGFVKHCAEEARFAKSQATLDYALPPGRKRQAAALKQSADGIFALSRLVLELGPEQTAREQSKASPWQHISTKSMTEDRDSETLWSAAETDFSFFGDEECGLPSLEPGRFAHSFSSDGKEVHVTGAQTYHLAPQVKATVQPRFDTVALLSAFRKDRKLAHARHVEAAGADDVETEGYWPGVVQVVRPGIGLRADEELDYYGNRFENGYLYR